MNKKRKKIFLIIFSVILFLLLVFSVFFSLININNNNINGISINNIDVSGLSKEDATAKLCDIINYKKEKNLIIQVNTDEEITENYDYLEVNYNINDAINNAFNIGRSSNIFKNNFQIFKLIFKKQNINLNIEINDEKLNLLCNELSSNLENKVIQSSYYIEKNNLIITKGKAGNIINENDFKYKLYNILYDFSSLDNRIQILTQTIEPDSINIDKIYSEIHKNAQNAYYEENPFKVYPETIGISFNLDTAKSLLGENQEEYIIELEYTYPEITINDLNINIFRDKLAAFTTYYDTSNKDRSNNL